MTLRIANQLNEDFNSAFALAAADPKLIHKAGQAHASRPPGWPYALDWIQLVSADADLYPDWIFDGPRVAEFCIAAIFAAAKRMPAIWIKDPANWRPIRQGKVSGAVLGRYGSAASAPRSRRARKRSARASWLCAAPVRRCPKAWNAPATWPNSWAKAII